MTEVRQDISPVPTKRERRVTISLRIPERIKRELARLGKRKFQTMSSCAADILINGVERIRTGVR
jgi:uncharacterized protein YcbK (DUF882 family)